jgi:hypothetical protein
LIESLDLRPSNLTRNIACLQDSHKGYKQPCPKSVGDDTTQVNLFLLILTRVDPIPYSTSLTLQKWSASSEVPSSLGKDRSQMYSCLESMDEVPEHPSALVAIFLHGVIV